jgi:hypothetical protein
MSLTLLAIFGATGAITAGSGPPRIARVGGASAVTAPEAPQLATRPTATRAAAPSAEGGGETARANPTPAPTGGESAAPAAPAAKPAQNAPTAAAEAAAPSEAPTARPSPVGTIPARATVAPAEGSVAQRLQIEAVDSGLKVTAKGAAKTTSGQRAVLAIFVEIENVGTAVVRVDPANFKLTDRTGTKYPVSRIVELGLAAIELAPRASPSDAGKTTSGNLTFDIPRTASGLALLYEAPGGPNLKLPLPPEFGASPGQA